jgi:hypothetical protein
MLPDKVSAHPNARGPKSRPAPTARLVKSERQHGDHGGRQHHPGKDAQQPPANHAAAPRLNPASTTHQQGKHRSRAGEQVEGEQRNGERDHDNGQVAHLDACEHSTIIRASTATVQAHMQARDRPIWAEPSYLPHREMGTRPTRRHGQSTHATDTAVTRCHEPPWA